MTFLSQIPPDVNTITNLGAMGLLAYLLIFGMPRAVDKLIAAHADTMDAFERARLADQAAFDVRTAEIAQAMRDVGAELRNQTAVLTARLDRNADIMTSLKNPS